MLNNSSKIMFLMVMMTGTILSVSSTSWLSAWMGLEINLLAFIPLMTANNNLMSSEAAMKYFLTQALASSVLLLSIIAVNMKSSMFNEFMYKEIPPMTMMSALMLKTGAAPFHFWFPSVMEGLTWTNSLIMMTWQKIAPIMLMSLTINKMNSLMTMAIIMSALTGAIGGLNQTSLRKIMAFSSINHIAWMLMALNSSEWMWMLYLAMYTLLSFNMVAMFKALKLIHINQLFSTMFTSKPLKFSLMMNMLSLGGLPPFLGFFPKWMIIQTLVMNNQMYLMTLLTITSLITLYFYLRMSYSALMLNYNEMSWINKQTNNNTNMNILMFISFISNFSLLTTSLSLT